MRKYTWGLDLAGQSRDGDGAGSDGITGAGGIGGLLAARDNVASKSYTYLYDGNGNVCQMIDLANGSGAVIVKYEYDAYGNLTSNWAGGAGTAFPANNPWKFSTKYWDAESGLGYWGYRYYSPRLGRWMSRDAVELRESNLFTYCKGEPTDGVDPRGEWFVYHHPLKPGSWPRPGPLTPCLGPGIYGSPRHPNDPTACTNGCSVPGYPGSSPSGVEFTPACNQHDRCYSTIGKDRMQCDREFYEDLIRICRANAVNGDQLGRCLAWAQRFFWGVRAKGKPYYEAAQCSAQIIYTVAPGS